MAIKICDLLAVGAAYISSAYAVWERISENGMAPPAFTIEFRSND